MTADQQTLDKADTTEAATLAGTEMSGAEILLHVLAENGVDTVFGYPGGAVLPLYDALFMRNDIKHVLVRHEQGAVHAAEGYARSTGKLGVVLVTSGPGATNAVTGLTDALLDSIPVLCICGQVPTHLIGNDAFQEADTTGITRSCTKHNYLVKDVNRLEQVLREATLVARRGRPGPVVIDLPKDVQLSNAVYAGKKIKTHKSYRPQSDPDPDAIERAVEMIAKAKRPIFYTGGGVINAGPRASELLTELVHLTGYPITNTLMGLGSFPATDDHFVGMLGMHGTYEANWAMHDCDLMVCIGARFDDRVTGRVDAFSPDSTKIHIDIDSSSINKNVAVDLPIVGDAGKALELMVRLWKQKGYKADAGALKNWWAQINDWRTVKCLNYHQDTAPDAIIKPQYALERLQVAAEAWDQGRDQVFITTEVGQHQMWAAQYLPFTKPNRWMTSGGLGTMGYGIPAAVGVQMGNPEALVIDVAGDASVMMTIQELATAVQYRLPIKIFILNNEWMGMVRQWQELMHGERYSESYCAALPDFVKLAESFHCKGFRATNVGELDDVIQKMIETDGPVIADICVCKVENCFPMIPSGAAHNEMLLNPGDREAHEQSEEGRMMV